VERRAAGVPFAHLFTTLWQELVAMTATDERIAAAASRLA
jgi:hypothetical protein